MQAHNVPDPNASSWDLGNCILNTYYCDNYSDTIVKEVAAHEAGHVFGLTHNTSDNGTLMWPYTSTRTATVPTADEVNGINAKY